MRNKQMAEVHDISNWWGGVIAAVPVVGFWYKTRADLRAEILKAEKAAALARQKAEELKVEMASCRLSIQQEFVTNTALQSVVADIKTDAKEREHRVTQGIKGIHTRLDNLVLPK